MRREYWQRQSGERWISGGGGARQAQSSACVNARPARHCMRRSPASRTHPVGIHAASGDNRRRFWDDVTVVRPNGRQPDGIVAADYGVENAAARKSVLSQEVPANMAHWVPAATLECRRRPASRPAGAACLAARHAGRLGAGSAIRCLWPSSIGRSPRSTVSTPQPWFPALRAGALAMPGPVPAHGASPMIGSTVPYVLAMPIPMPRKLCAEWRCCQGTRAHANARSVRREALSGRRGRGERVLRSVRAEAAGGEGLEGCPKGRHSGYCCS